MVVQNLKVGASELLNSYDIASNYDYDDKYYYEYDIL